MADVRAPERPAGGGPLAGLTVAITADRKGAELRASLERLGAGVVWGSTMRAVPPEVDDELVDETDAMLEAAPTWFAVSTGSGLRSWLAAANASGRGAAVEQLLRETKTVARGAKSHGALRALGVEPLFVSPQETMDDVCSWLGERLGPRDTLGAQVHGGEVIGTLERLRPQVRGVHTVAPYRWVLPEDLEAAEQVVTDLLSGRVHVLAQTSAPSARNLVRVADRMGRRGELIEALRGPVCIAVVGPVTARAFEEIGVGIDVMPKRPRTADLLRMISALGGGAGSRGADAVRHGPGPVVRARPGRLGRAHRPEGRPPGRAGIRGAGRAGAPPGRRAATRVNWRCRRGVTAPRTTSPRCATRCRGCGASWASTAARCRPCAASVTATCVPS